jgi:sigma-B regulation protein RsbU (phosphoserine phosphatase)
MLFGVLPDAEYPVRHIPLKAGDRFLLYTDGLTEAENERGESFGERQLPTLMRMNSSRSAQEFVGCVLPAFKAWQRASSAQEDDMTMIVIDVVAMDIAEDRAAEERANCSRAMEVV